MTTTANIELLRTSYSKGMTNLGEAARAQDFLLEISQEAEETAITGISDMKFLVQAATIPAIKREVVETVGPFGVRSIEQGRFINEIEMAITFKDVVTGIALKFLKKWSRDKLYLSVLISLVSESLHIPTAFTQWTIQDCWIELDGADLSVEDAVPLKLSGTLHGSYFPNRIIDGTEGK